MSAEFDSHAVPLPNEAQTLVNQLSATLNSFLGQLRVELVSLRVSPAPAAAATLSTFTDSQQTPAARSNLDRSYSAPAVMPSAEYTVPSETVPADMKAPSKCLTDGTGSKCGAFTNKDRQASPDDWISHMNESSQTSFVTPASWLSEMAPAVHIVPFDGNPFKWGMFISSFKSFVHDVVGSNDQRLAILRQLLDMRRLYGNSSAVIAACLRKLSNIEPVKVRCDLDVERFYLEIHGVLNVLRARDRVVQLKSAYTLHAVVPKLTYHLQRKWARRIFEIRPREPTIEDLDQWLEQIVLTNRMVEPAESSRSQSLTVRQRPSNRLSKSRRSHLNVTTVVSDVPCVLCQGDHLLSACPQFLSFTPNRRAEIVKERGSCFACLDDVHVARHCPQKESDHVESELEIYERFWKTESFGTKPITECQDMNPARAIEWPSSFRFVDGRYESDKASEENAITLRSGRLMRSRPRLNSHRRPPPRSGVRTVSHESNKATATEIAAAATASVATQMAGMFESFLTQLRTDLQELKLSGRPGLSSLGSPNNGDALAGREVGRAEGP
ncbi:hypothetical protein TTRE_0000932401, partial [Trichuris trichiura]